MGLCLIPFWCEGKDDMKRYVKAAAAVILCLIVGIAGIFSVYAAGETDNLNIAGYVIPVVWGQTRWSDFVDEVSAADFKANKLCDGIVDGSFVVLRSHVIEVNGVPVKPDDIIYEHLEYVDNNHQIYIAEIYDNDRTEVVYTFGYPAGWTFGEYNTYMNECREEFPTRFKTLIDVTEGTVYFDNKCVEYPIMYTSNGDCNVGLDLGISNGSQYFLSTDSIGAHYARENLVKHTDPTCTEYGRDDYACNCGYSTDYVLIDPLGHSYALESVRESTCSSAGAKRYKCSTCGDTYEEAIEPLAHDWKAATCTSPKTCKTCGETDGGVLEHDYNVFGVCKNCGYNWFNRFFGSDGNDDQSGSSDSSGEFLGGVEDSISDGVNSVKNWFSDLGKTIDTIFGIVLGVLGVVLFCILGTYVIRFVKELIPDQSGQSRRRRK